MLKRDFIAAYTVAQAVLKAKARDVRKLELYGCVVEPFYTVSECGGQTAK